MSEIEVGDADEPSPLTLFERVLVAIAMWPTVLSLGVGVPAALLDDDTGLEKVGMFIGFSVAVSVGKGLWRFFTSGRFRAGMVFGAFGLIPMLAISATTAAVAIGVSLDEQGLDRLTDERDSQRLLASESTSSEGAERPSFLASPLDSLGPDNTFATCIKELHRSRDTRSIRREALTVLRGVAGPDLVEDAVQDVMISVCMQYDAGEVEELRSYFFGALRKTRADLEEMKMTSRLRYCEFEPRHEPIGERDYDAREELRYVRAAMCRIDSQQAYVIRKRMDGASHREIAEELGTTAANSRQLLRRGRKSLAELVKKMSNYSHFR